MTSRPPPSHNIPAQESNGCCPTRWPPYRCEKTYVKGAWKDLVCPLSRRALATSRSQTICGMRSSAASSPGREMIYLAARPIHGTKAFCVR
jgi:hypothetical protein